MSSLNLFMVNLRKKRQLHLIFDLHRKDVAIAYKCIRLGLAYQKGSWIHCKEL